MLRREARRHLLIVFTVTLLAAGLATSYEVLPSSPLPTATPTATAQPPIGPSPITLPPTATAFASPEAVPSLESASDSSPESAPEIVLPSPSPTAVCICQVEDVGEEICATCTCHNIYLCIPE